MTGPEHYLEAERLIASAEAWMNADFGWKAHLGHDERIAFKAAELAEAQVHATLALAAATAAPVTGDMPVPDADAWTAAASAYKPPVKLNGPTS